MNPNNFLLSTDYPLDKVVYQKTVTVSINAFDFHDVTIPHALPFVPLTTAQWSTDSGFAVTYNENGGPVDSSGYRKYDTSVESDATNIYIFTTNNTASSITLYFTIYGLMPSNVNAEAPYTAFTGDDFVLNTDFNYSKLLLSGIIPGVIASGTSTTSRVDHNLGYYPQVSVWSHNASSGRYTHRTVDNDYGGSAPSPFNWARIHLTTSSLIVTFLDTTQVLNTHYRIYADQAAA